MKQILSSSEKQKLLKKIGTKSGAAVSEEMQAPLFKLFSFSI
ncbi:hypothetical protein [Pedobacter aquatilis]|nr:hypothetical protein [Pedobacter aquatilis]